MHRQACIYVAGGDTLLGSALIEHLTNAGYENLVGVPPHEPDLLSADQVEDFFHSVRPEFVFVAGGPSGGIEENRRHPADLMIDNLLVMTNVVPAAFRHGARKLLYVASACCYPKDAPQPLNVASLFSGPLEPTSDAYASAKLAGIRLCQAYRQQYDAPFIMAIPANMFGPGDDFHPESGHVIPALISRMHKAKARGNSLLTLWGTGAPRRDFLFVADAAEACVFLMSHYDEPEPINIATGQERSIAEAAALIARAVGYEGRVQFEGTRRDGAPRKALDARPLLNLGWCPRADFGAALTETYAWYRHHAIVQEEHHAVAVA